MKKLALIPLLRLMPLACSTSEMMAGPNFQYFKTTIIEDTSFAVYRHDKRENYWAAARASILCCVEDPRNFQLNIIAIEAVSGCDVDDTFVTHKGVLTKAFVICEKSRVKNGVKI